MDVRLMLLPSSLFVMAVKGQAVKGQAQRGYLL